MFCYNFSFILTGVEFLETDLTATTSLISFFFSIFFFFFLLMHLQGTVAARMEIANASAGVTLGDGSLARASKGLAALLASALLNNQRLAQARRSLTFVNYLSFLSSICPVNECFSF